MSSTVLYMSMSLDGFIAGPNERPDNGLGDGGDRLHEWVFPGAEKDGDFEAAVARLRGVNRQIYDEFMSTGAVVAGRGTFEPAGGWGGDHHDGVPIYILSRNPAPAWAADWPTVHYVSDLEAAMRDCQARCRRQERAGPRGGHRAARPHRRAPRRARDPPGPGPVGRWAAVVRAPRHRTARAGADQSARRRGWRHPPSLPRPPLMLRWLAFLDGLRDFDAERRRSHRAPPCNPPSGDGASSFDGVR